MSLKVENIKKMMGWCPNAKIHEARQQIHLENIEANDRSGGSDRPRGERNKIKRNSKQFLFSFFASICAIIVGTASTIMESLVNFYLVLMGIGLLLNTLSISETDAKLSKLMSICSDVFLSAMCFWLGVDFYLRSSGSVVAKLFVLLGVYGAAKAIYLTVSIYIKKAHEEAF
ncbi:DUF1673 family protein [Methanosarcina sp. Z-7115]|uniref:DUF1673 family protein n=1 Tax=Methanosarcina baikalica TaxID=3073890 RepID=A0ABU2D2M1_9EURY|nr:DUF1673 family protein [Methanosarcina sp. Z-7115]MDR7666229.1 DUF1673 family protein [Methanosarcina sp. Z-7115]